MRRTLVPPLGTAPLPPALGSVVHALHGRTMGTTWSVKLVADPTRALPPLQQAIQQQLDCVVAQMSTWEADSDLSQFNRAAAGSWHTLPAEFFSVLDYALQVARDSDGAYDPTAGALVNLWSFGPTQQYGDAGFAAPSPAALETARNQCGWQRIWIDSATQRVQQPGDVYIDLSAIAKGYGVDQVARHLLQLGFDSFLVEAGGELRGEGVKPDGQPWWVALEHPLPDALISATPNTGTAGDAGAETIAALYGWSVATSGDYRRYFKDGATRYSHTIDPRSGVPIRHDLASVTVLHRECMAADAWSTALGVLGPQDGMAYADAHGIAALFIKRGKDGFEEFASRSLTALLQ
jgi:thiamine biosynthesis lipoprotein